jgi:TPR repeat protein
VGRPAGVRRPGPSARQTPSVPLDPQLPSDDDHVVARSTADPAGTTPGTEGAPAEPEETLRARRELSLRTAAEHGDAAAALALAQLLRESGRQFESWHWAQLAADAGDTTAAGTLACWRWVETRDLALEPQLRAGADHSAAARAGLADLLRVTGRVEEARTVLERGAVRGEVASWLPLGNIYREELDDVVAAEAAYRAGIEGGDIHSHHNLGVLLLGTGDVEGAIEHFSIAAAGGDELAARVLREVLYEG